MLSNQVLQKITTDIRRITGMDCSVWNIKGKCLVSTCEEEKECSQIVEQFLEKAESQEVEAFKDHVYFSVCDEGELLYVLVIHSAGEGVEMMGRLCVSQFETVAEAYRKRLDKNRFFQELLLGNLLDVDVFNQAKRLGITESGKRMVYIIEPKSKEDGLVLAALKGLYATGTKDVVLSVEEGQLLLIKTLQSGDSGAQITHIARTIADTLSAETMVDIRVAYGTVAEELKEISRSYKEAKMALEAGGIFYAERNILAYNELGIGRLIYELPKALCELFLNEVLRGNAADQFDKETLVTVNAFFKNNLNISETARQMYLHRNTLGYRLDKITKTTGLDIRKFDDALTFKIALMVSDYMKSTQLCSEEEQR